MSDDNKGSRLPPPAFPPGSRKHLNSNHAASADELGDGFISPDEPLPERDHTVEEAFISPDEPLPERSDDDVEATFTPDPPAPRSEPMTDADGLPQFETEGGVVTGMDMDDHTDPEDLMAALDPHLADLVHKVDKLAAALKSKGEAGLRTAPDMDKFESTLRGYCVGYLAGRRAEDDPSGADF